MVSEHEEACGNWLSSFGVGIVRFKACGSEGDLEGALPYWLGGLADLLRGS